MSLVNNIHANNINVKLLNTFRRFSGCLLAGAATVAVVSCNEKTEDVEIYLTPSNVAVTAFSLNEDDDVMANLDSVFFSIDLANGVIFNADSLPIGTKIDKLVTTIKYSSYVTKAMVLWGRGRLPGCSRQSRYIMWRISVPRIRRLCRVRWRMWQRTCRFLNWM